MGQSFNPFGGSPNGRGSAIVPVMHWQKTLALMTMAASLHAAESWKFDFGSDAPAEGFTAVRATDRFTEEKGYGFDLKGEPVDGAKSVTGEGGFYFSVAAEPGNYLVKVKVGDPSAASDTTIKAESRRLMIWNDKHAAAEPAVRSFVVNVRNASIGKDEHVHLKDREKPCLHWDHKLTLEFNGPHPAIDALEITPAPDATTVFLLGDSTVTDQPNEPWNSWGQMLPVFFDGTVAVSNHAESGESVRSSLGANRFRQVYHSMKKGDYVFIQFGHNDMKDKRPDALDTYRKNLGEAVKTIRWHGGHPVLVTSMERKAGVKADTLGEYPDTVREVAEITGATLIDLHQTSRALYKALGGDLGAAFQDGTHHNPYGSYLLAGCVAEGIRAELPELAKHFREGMARVDPSAPMKPEEFVYAPSPVKDMTKPDGD